MNRQDFKKYLDELDTLTLDQRKVIYMKLKKKFDKKAKKETGIPFDSFWNEYPKKIGKTGARLEWNKLSELEKKEAIEFIDTYKETQMTDNDTKFIKHPQSYLKTQRWKDGVPEFLKQNKTWDKL